MKINRGAIIFIAIFGGVALIIALVVMFSNLLRQPSDGAATGVDDLFSALFPFGQGTVRQPGTGVGTTNDLPSGPVPVLREISREPVAGFGVFSTSTVRYTETNTGHIFETRTDSLATIRRTNATFPGIERAVWISGNNVIYQNAGSFDVENSMISFSTTTVDQNVFGRPLSEFNTVSVAPMLQGLLTMSRSGPSTTIYLTDYLESQRQILFSSPIKSWRVLPGGEDVYLETSPSDSVGFLYKILGNGGLEKIRGGERGLMATVRDDGAYIAVSSVNDEGTRLIFIGNQGGLVGESPVATFSEKCAWLKEAEPRVVCGVPQLPTNVSVEGWYMGLRSFNDGVWIIDPIKETATFVRNLEAEAGRQLDIVDPQISSDGRYFVFKNKNDLSLWSLDLTR